MTLSGIRCISLIDNGFPQPYLLLCISSILTRVDIVHFNIVNADMLLSRNVPLTEGGASLGYDIVDISKAILY